MRKKIIAILLCAAMLSGVAACAAGKKDGGTVSTASTQLMVLRTDYKFSQEEVASRIKAEYLKENNGYKDSDVIVAIITLPGKSLADTWLEGSKYSTLAEYAQSPEGVYQASVIKKNQDGLIAELTEKGLITGVKYRYDTLTNAVAVTTTYGGFKKIGDSGRVASTYLSDTYNRPKSEKAGGASGIVNLVDVYETGIFNSGSVSYTGKGTSVAVLDSGFDLSHPVFSTMPDVEDDKLTVTRDSVSAVLASSNAAKTTQGLEIKDVYVNNKIPYVYDYADKDYDVFPYDSEHGTHVAGIIGGKTPDSAKTETEQGIVGVAVDTQIVCMKVFPDLTEGGKTEDIIAAVEDAVLLNVDAINMSLGSSCGFAREEDGSLINAVYDKVNASGVSLIVAASNSYSSAQGGEQGNTAFTTNPDYGTVGSPTTYAAATSVASISGVKSRYFVANNKDVVFWTESNSTAAKKNDFYKELYEAMGWDVNDKEEHTLEYVTVPGVGLKVNYSSINVKGKIALVRRGDSTFEDKALQAKAAGAIGCIIYNNVEGNISMSMGKTEHVPTISISKEDGTALAAYASGKLTFSADDQAGPFMSDFSSWGPSPNLELKPEITAHGGDIKSSIPGGGYDQLSGTSMACPNLCGITLLIRHYVKDNFKDIAGNAKEVKLMTNRLLMSTATIALDRYGIAYSPRKQGAGLASLKKVVSTGAYIEVPGCEKTKLELKDDPTRTGVYEMNFNVVNVSDKDIHYDLSVLGLTDEISSSDERFVSERGKLLSGSMKLESTTAGAVNGTTLTAKAGETTAVKLTYSISDADRTYIERYFTYGTYVEGFVKLETTDKNSAGEDEVSLNVPFLAFYGDWTEAPMFDKDYYQVDKDKNDASLDEDDKVKADYYATTPYGTYFYNYIIPLGTYLYDIDTDKYDKIVASRDHIAISDSLGTISGLSTIYAGLLRGAKTMDFTIVDKTTGEVVWSKTEVNARKAYSNGGSPVPYFNQLKLSSKELGLVNNRTYQFKMVGKLDYGDGGVATNANNSFEYDFVLDNEAPMIKSCTYEKVYDKALKKDRYYINMVVYDNQYVMSVSPVLFTSNNSYTTLTKNAIPVYSQKGTDNKVRIEITDYLENVGYDKLLSGSLAFSVDDYALNSNIFVCQLPGTAGEIKFTKDGEWDSPALNILSVYEDEVVDLTDKLATADENVDENKDYLRYLKWESSNPAIAEVEDGLVKGIKPGRATITATRNGVVSQESLSSHQAMIIINVKKRTTATQSLAAQTEETVVRSKAPASEGEVTVMSNNGVSNANDASVKSLRFAYFDTLFAYSRAAGTSEIGKTGERKFITAVSGSVKMYPGERIQLACDMDPWYVADKYEMSYQTSNEAIAKVNQDGTVTAMKEGSVTITASLSGSNIKARFRINVQNPFIVENYVLVSYKGYVENGVVEIPEEEGVLYIGAYAFCLYTTDNTIEVDEDDYDANKIPASNSSVKKVIVPDTVEEIRKYAFYNCTGLEEVELKGEVKYLREYAFSGDAKLKKINLGNVEVIGKNAFYGCTSLTSLDLNKCYSIGEAAFQGCTGLTAVDLSKLRNAGKEMFKNCTNLKSVVLGPDTKLSYGAFVKSGLTSVDLYANVVPQFAFAQCNDLKKVVIHNDMLYIDKGAFCQNPNLETVELLGKIELIDEQAFYDCPSLKKIKLPGGKVTIGLNAFYNCNKLEEIIIPADLEKLSFVGSGFRATGVKKFTVEAGNKNFTTNNEGTMLYSDGGKKLIAVAFGAVTGDVTIPAEVQSIGAGAFGGTAITSVTFLNPDIKIGDYAFANCDSLEKATFAAGGKAVTGIRSFYADDKLTVVENMQYIAEIGDYSFAATSVAEANIGDNVICGEGAFFNGKVTVATVGENVKLGLGAFQNCKKLVKVNMPDKGGVHIGKYCFAYATELKEIDLSKTDDRLEEAAFFNCTSLKKANLVNVKYIEGYVFADCAKLEEVLVPAVVEIGQGAFAKYEKESGAAPRFTEIVLPETLTKIGDGAFASQTSLENITLPASLTAENTGSHVFYMCSALKTVVLPETLTKINENTFAGCTSLESVNLGNVKVIADNAFNTCTSLKNIDLTSAEEVGYAAFAFVPAQGEITANNLKKIGAYAFERDNAKGGPTFTSFTANKLEEIGEGAFWNVKTLKKFVFTENLKKAEMAAFLECDGIESFYFLSEGKEVADGEFANAAVYEGSLYMRAENGKWILSSVPGGKTGTLNVKEGTVKVEVYAGSMNKNITEIVFPMSLKSIGKMAFYKCDALQKAEFRSLNAPTLENENVSGVTLAETDPGYKKLYSQYQLFGLDMCYMNFVDLLGKKEPLKMVVPSNANISGYDSIVYEVYFGELKDAERSSFVAMENSMAKFIEYAEEIMKKEVLTMADETLVSDAVTAYNGIKGDYTQFGYDKETWDAMVKASTDAYAYIRQLKFSHASYKVKQLQAQIDSLAGEYDKNKVPTMEDIQAKLKNFTPAEREVLDLTAYNQFFSEYEKHKNDPDKPDKPDPKPDDPDNPDTPDENKSCGNCKSKTGYDAAGAMMSVIVLAGVAFILKRKNNIG